MKTRIVFWILIILCTAKANIASADNMVKRAEGSISLDNGLLRISFSDGKEFKLLEMTGDNHAWLPTSGYDGYLWLLTLKGPDGVNPQIKSIESIYEGVTVDDQNSQMASLVFNWKLRLSQHQYYPVRMKVSIEKGSALSDWSFETDLPEGWKVAELDFPRLSVVRSKDAKMIMPEGWGVEYPMVEYASYESQYPSHSGCMQMMCLQEGKDVLYFATHDTTASIKTFRAKSQWESAFLTSEVVASEAWTPDEGGTFRLPWTTSIGFTSAGWEDAALKWYRPFSEKAIWGRKTFASRNLPEWLLNADMWFRPHFVTQETHDWLKKGIEFFGPEAVCHWYRWHETEYDVNYPEYFPPKENFTSMLREFQGMGTHIIPYINGRLWDPANKSYKELNGKDASCRAADGCLYTETYGSMVPNTVTCPSTKIWQDIIYDLSQRIQNELGTNGLYIDQVGAARGVPCYAKNHPHPAGGGEFWHSSYRTLIGKVREGLKPGNVIMTEENSECYLDLFDMMLLVNTPQGPNCRQVPLFALIYSDRVLAVCYLYYPLTERTDGLTFRWKNVMGLLWGSQLGWTKPELVMAPEARTEAEFLREMVRFRKQQHDLIYGGRFMREVFPTGDNPMLEIPGMMDSPAVRGAEWVGPKGNRAILMVNMDDKPHNVLLDNGKELKMRPLQCVRMDMK